MGIIISIAKNNIFQISLIMVFGSKMILKASKMSIIERGGIPCPKGIAEVFCPIET